MHLWMIALSFWLTKSKHLYIMELTTKLCAHQKAQSQVSVFYKHTDCRFITVYTNTNLKLFHSFLLTKSDVQYAHVHPNVLFYSV